MGTTRYETTVEDKDDLPKGHHYGYKVISKEDFVTKAPLPTQEARSSKSLPSTLTTKPGPITHTQMSQFFIPYEEEYPPITNTKKYTYRVIQNGEIDDKEK